MRHTPILLWALLVGALSAGVARGEDAPNPSAAGAGQQVARVCAVCHSFEPNADHKTGPNLWGIVNSPMAAKPGFQYSQALRSHAGTWDPQSLDFFLANPQGYLPGNKMPYPGLPDPAARAAVIAYLVTLSDSPQTNSAEPLGPGGSTSQDYGGLAEDARRPLVYYTCSACHSIHIVRQQGLNRERWQETLDWMVEEQGMDALPPEEHEQVLSYLSEHYGED